MTDANKGVWKRDGKNRECSIEVLWVVRVVDEAAGAEEEDILDAVCDFLRPILKRG